MGIAIGRGGGAAVLATSLDGDERARLPDLHQHTGQSSGVRGSTELAEVGLREARRFALGDGTAMATGG